MSDKAWNCYYLRLRFWSCCCKNIYESFAPVGVYSQTGLGYMVCSFSWNSVRLYWKVCCLLNILSYLIFPFFIWIIQLLCFGFYHNLIGTHYFYFLFSIISFFIFGIGFHNISILFEGIQYRHSTSYKKTKVRGKHQDTFQCIQLV